VLHRAPSIKSPPPTNLRPSAQVPFEMCTFPSDQIGGWSKLQPR
jgi:hypothetical protein